MASIVFTAPQHLHLNQVMTWAPGVLFVNGRPHFLKEGDYVYVCHRNRILFRARWEGSEWSDDKITTEGEHRGPGWVVKVGAPQVPPQPVTYASSHGFRYLYQGELW